MFNVGDRVTVRSREEIEKLIHGLAVDFVSSMFDFCGETYTVKKTAEKGETGVVAYKLEGRRADGVDCWWFDEKVLLPADEPPILPHDKVHDHLMICHYLNDLYARKNRDYGDSFHLSYEEEGMAMARIRLTDKLNRFKTLTRSESQEVKDESVKDTLIDLANYAIMTVMELGGIDNADC